MHAAADKRFRMLAVFALVAAALAFTATSGRVDFLPRRRRRAAEPHGGEYVWDNQNKGWGARCSASACDWKIVGDTGAGRSITQLAIQNGTWYAAWCGPCNGSFERGILTNAGGTAHLGTLPNVSVNDLQLIDGGTKILAATHGRGLWQISTP